MIFNRLPLVGAYLIELEPRRDVRGMFARAFCAREFEHHGLETRYVQANLSTNVATGTVRGMHFQLARHAEVKLVRCIRGSLFDVIVDLREGSPTFRQWYGSELTEENGLMMYVPNGFAHGYQALTDGATAHYLVSTYYEPGAEGGCRCDDPAINVRWPMPVTSISDKDAAWPLL
jgi:dTDP-4-dehydrorhamnose 3,5-epimerase